MSEKEIDAVYHDRNKDNKKPIRCYLGLHRGNVEPAHTISADIDGRSAFVCNRCGEVIE